ncbi:Septin-10 [Saguinus oedipus]|uniref:Septin n=1 Tax=Saguinus oedipus TaxID=9490 RepID=A0ABQ9U773_SAGOE|nr:Septin-10 [Saguinus oedipus]
MFVDYIDAQFEAYLQEELKIKRSLFTYHDSRIHVCLYFISPTGHSLKTLDLLTMKNLDSKVNIIPVIAKADTVSKTELQKFKIKLMSELVSNGVQIYQFPTDDDTIAKINAAMNGQLPFAVVGSMDEVKVGNKMVKARQYPWGVVQVENENHCDFVKLREMLISTNMEDLREQTHTRHYELYRRCKLEEMGFTDVGPENKPVSLTSLSDSKGVKYDEECMAEALLQAEGRERMVSVRLCKTISTPQHSRTDEAGLDLYEMRDRQQLLQNESEQWLRICSCSLQETYEAKRHEFHGERQRKEEEMKQMFVQRVKEKEAILKEAEREASILLQAKFEHLKRLHQEERMKLEEKRRLLEEEIIAFSKKKATSETFHNQSFLATGSNLRKDKDRKKEQSCRFELLCVDVRAYEANGGRKDAEKGREGHRQGGGHE